jgi:hypothetical protein
LYLKKAGSDLGSLKEVTELELSKIEEKWCLNLWLYVFYFT